MSIRRQLAIGIGLLMLVLLGGNLMLNIKQLKTHFEEQLQARADETATTLALSMTTSAELEDDAVLRSMIDVVFDRGYFKEVRFDYVAHDGFVARYARSDLAPDAPEWFQHWMNLRGGKAQASVALGWRQFGEVTVQLHPGFVYRDLWQLVQAEFAWFMLMTLIAVYGVRLLLAWQLAALPELLELAEKLSENQFVKIDHKPAAKEFEKLVNAMNALSGRLQASYKAHGETVRQLQRDKYQDDLTGLDNRRGWDHFLQDWMTHDGFAPGWMMLVQVGNLADLNQSHGKNEVDGLLKQIGDTLKHDTLLTHENVHIARPGGSEFWIFCPDPLDRAFKPRIQGLFERLNQLSRRQAMDAQLVAAALPLAQVLEPAAAKHQLDLVLRQAQEENQPCLIGETQDHQMTNWVHWQQKLKKILQHKDILLFSQPLVNHERALIQQEIHCRLKDDHGQPMMAGFFWPLIEELKLAADFDRLILRKWMKQVDDEISEWVINISGQSLNDETFRIWFETEIPERYWGQLILEFSEYSLAHADEDVESWLHGLVHKGLRISVDHLGTSGESFGFLARFPLAQGKIERRYIRNIHEHKDNRFFVAGMIKVLHSQGAKCFVEGVERDEEMQSLIDLGVDGMMGYGVFEPQRLELAS